MRPDQRLALAAITNIAQTVSHWPVAASLLLIILLSLIGPWIVIYLISRTQERRASAHDLRTVEMMAEIKEVFSTATAEHDKRFATMATMYENNVLLVKGYEKHASDLASIIHLNIQGMTKLVEKIDNNMFCPVIRERGPHGN